MSLKAALIDSTSLAAKVAGFGSFGLAVEDFTGDPGTFWVAAFIGAVLIRKPLEGADGDKAKLKSIAAGVGIAWMATNPLLDFLGLSQAVYQVVAAGALAAFGEQFVTVATNPDKLKRWVDLWKGRK